MLTILEGEDKSSPFTNRIRKNYQHLRKWAKRSHTDCFRLYDRDIKEYPLAIDYYAGHFSVQLYSFNECREDLLEEARAALQTLFGVSEEKIICRTRFKRKKIEQYEKIDSQGRNIIVLEYGAKFWVNLTDYLDTGLFLDHRETRRLVAATAKGRRVLNLFAYTCSFSVQAALAGSLATTSVDLSNTYTDWGRANFELNNLPQESNKIIRADCLQFLADAAGKQMYDIIILDPPTLSRSKKMVDFFDIQRDYPRLISQTLELLAPQGTLFFSTNSRRFIFDTTLFTAVSIQNITQKTHPIDFRNQKIHQCWQISNSP